MRCGSTILAALAAVTVGLGAATARADSIDLVLRPVTPLVVPGQVLEVRLYAHHSGSGPFLSPQAQSFLALDAVLQWDPAKLKFLGISSTGAIPMLFSYLPTGSQDYTGLNEANPPRDGDLFYTGATPLGQPRNVMTADALVTTFRFQVLGAWGSSAVQLLTDRTVTGTANTIVYDGTVAGLGVTGALVPAQVHQCLADIDHNGSVDGADLAMLLAAYGTSTPSADLDGSGTVDGSDLGLLLAAWGPCK